MQDYVPYKPTCPACGLEVTWLQVAAKDLSHTNSLWYHLNCFPAMPFLRADTEVVNHVFDRGNREVLVLWIRRHNAGLESNRLTMLETRFGQRLCAGELPGLQSVLEFLPVKEICGNVAVVNRKWYGTSWSRALWDRLWCRDGSCLPFCLNTVQLHPKLRFALVALAACFWCNRSPLLSEVVIYCPVTLRPICRECRGAGDFLVTASELQYRFGMALDFVKSLKVPVFQYNGQVYAYFPLVIEGVIRHRIRRAEKVIAKVSSLLPPATLDVYRQWKYFVTSGFPLLAQNEPSKVLRYILALSREESCSLQDATAELRAQYLPNLNTDN